MVGERSGDQKRDEQAERVYGEDEGDHRRACVPFDLVEPVERCRRRGAGEEDEQRGAVHQKRQPSGGLGIAGCAVRGGHDRNSVLKHICCVRRCWMRLNAVILR